jgi:hypothetical protein
VDHPQAVEIEPERKGAEPVEVRGQFAGRNLPHRLGVLMRVLLVMGAEVFARAAGIGRMECQGIEFMVAHDGLGCAGLHHRPDDLQRLANLGSTVDEVAEEDRLAVGVPIDALLAGVPELLEQPFEGGSVAVDVTDEVVHAGVHYSSVK